MAASYDSLCLVSSFPSVSKRQCLLLIARPAFDQCFLLKSRYYRDKHLGCILRLGQAFCARLDTDTNLKLVRFVRWTLKTMTPFQDFVRLCSP